MGGDRVYLAGIRQEVGLPLRAVAVAMTDFSEPPLKLLQIAVYRVAELTVGAKAPPNIVKRLLARLGVEGRDAASVSPRRHRSHISTAASLSMTPAISGSALQASGSV